MAIPDFQSTMLPLLEFCADGREHNNQEALDALADHFALTDAERTKLLPSGNQRVFDNRIAWARYHMRRANLIENPKRGVFRLTPRGKAVLVGNPAKINIKFLQQFPEYVKLRSARKEPKPEPPGKVSVTSPRKRAGITWTNSCCMTCSFVR